MGGGYSKEQLEQQVKNATAEQAIRHLRIVNQELKRGRNQPSDEVAKEFRLLMAEMLKQNSAQFEKMSHLRKGAQEASAISVENFEEYDNKQYGTWLGLVKEMKKPPLSAKKSVAFLGATCVGKSSLINELVGEEVAPTSYKENTEGIECVYTSDSVDIYDIYGTNAVKTYACFESLTAIMTLHKVICLYTTAVQNVKRLAEFLAATGIKEIHFSYNKIDMVSGRDRRELLSNDKALLEEWCPGCTCGQSSAKQYIGLDHLTEYVGLDLDCKN